MKNSIMNDKALIKFWIGPVQSFVASARTARDLWTGSYLLAWLVRKGAEPVLQANGTFLVPDPAAFNSGPGGLRAATIPNHFTALVPADQAADLAKRCEQAARTAWNAVCGSVYEALQGLISGLPHADGWDRLWKHQCENFFDIRVLTYGGSDKPVSDVDQINRHLAAAKMIRHFPPDTPDDRPVPGKCSLMGDFEQMGPAGLKESRKFWDAFAAEHVTLDGTRVRRGERLCAISLVKRFAWAGHLAKDAGTNPDQLPMTDTPRVAAAVWLKDDTRKALKGHADRKKSGAWLYWHRRDQEEKDGENAVPEDIWQQLLNARRDRPPPTYYAILTLDGDKMGERFRNANDLDALRTISSQTSEFALNQVESIVRAHHGTLIYGGGDDVLALLPAQSAIACAKALSDAFAKCLTGATVSCGIAIVHHKEDLRFALEQSREAEKLAKSTGRNRLVLRVCRRSGEHTTAGLSWDACETFQKLIEHFISGATDRWAYKLRAVAEQLLPPDDSQSLIDISLLDSELSRLLKRAEDLPPKMPGDVKQLRSQVEQMSAAGSDRAQFLDFITLCQSASFLARGRDQ